jgi:hypothetical protein
VRPATTARLALGSAALAYPARLLGAVGGLDRGDAGTRVVVRVLGGRLLAQGLADLALGRRTRVPDVVIDTTHAASMVVVADRWPDHRRSALVSAAVASAIALLDVRRS